MPFCTQCGAPTKGIVCSRCGTPHLPDEARRIPLHVANMLCYAAPVAGPLLVLFLRMYPESALLRFNAFQSIFAFIGITLIESLLGAMTDFTYNQFGMLDGAVSLASLALFVYLAVQAFQMRKVVLPVVGEFAEKQVRPGASI